MPQEIHPNQNKKQAATEGSDGEFDLGPKITLAEFITAAYGLDPQKLYYNRFGRLSPLPPQAQEVYMRLAKRMKITSKDTFGCTVLFGDEECTNIREENIEKECEFHVSAYLKECNNLSINLSQGYIARRLSRLSIYSLKEHLYTFIWMSIIPAAVFIFLNFCFFTVGKSEIHPLDSVVPLLSGCLVAALILYLPLWEFVADSLERPFKKHKFEYSLDINEIQLRITTVLSTYKSYNKICEVICTLVNSKLKLEECKEYLAAELEKATSELRKLQSEHNDLLEQNRLLSEGMESIEQENKKLNNSIQTITNENHKLIDSNHELTSKNSTLSEDLNKLQSKHNDLFEQNRILSEKIESLEQDNKKLNNSIQTITNENHKLIDSNHELTSKNSTLSEDLNKLQSKHNDLLEQNRLLSEENKSIKEEINDLNNNIQTLINENQNIKNQKEAIEKEKPNIPALEKSKKLNLYFLMLICELLVSKHTPADLQEIKGTKNALIKISEYFDSLREKYPKHFESLSRPNWYNIFPELINFCFEKTMFDPRIIHRSYDGSYEPIEKVIDKL